MAGEIGAGAISAGSSIAGGLISGGFGMAMQKRQQKYNQENMRLSHQLNEEAADSADARKRAFYTDFESPEATFKQLKAAGLSPGLFYGGNGAGGMGASGGAQGAGTGTVSGAGYTGGDPGMAIQGLGMNLAQIQLMKAQARNLDADTQVKGGELDLQKASIEEIQARIQNLLADTKLKNVQEAYNRSLVRYTDLQATAQELQNGITEESFENIIKRYEWDWKKLQADYEAQMAAADKSKAEQKTIDETRELLKREYQARYEEIVSQIALNVSQAEVNREEIKEIAQMVLNLQAQCENEKKKPEWFEKELETRLKTTDKMAKAMKIAAGIGAAGNVAGSMIKIFAPTAGIGSAIGDLFQGTTSTTTGF